MSIHPRQPAPSGERDLAAHAAMLSRVQEQLSSRPRYSDRRCPLCAEPIRGGQAYATMHGTAVHARCRSAARR